MPPLLKSHLESDDHRTSFFNGLSDIKRRQQLISSSSSPSKNRSSRRRRLVSFYPQVQVHTGPNREDYSKEEFQSSWFTIAEMNELRFQSRQDAKIFQDRRQEQGKSQGLMLTPEQSFCIRGLECRTPIERVKRKFKREKIVMDVLAEQEFQRLNKESFPEALAAISSLVSASCVREARALAVADEAAAKTP